MTSTRHRLIERASGAAASAARHLPPAARSALIDVRDRLQSDGPVKPGGTGADTGALDEVISITNGTDKNLRYDVQTMAIIARTLGADDIAIDVGCHQGSILRHMVKAAPNARHLAFEPLPDLAEALRTNFPSVEVHQVALVAEPAGPLEFHHVVSNPGYSGILERAYDRPDESVEVISVPTARLDDIVPAEVNPALIKIDVEGAELGVLQGAEETIRRAKPVVVFENGLGAADVYGTTPEMIHDFFTSAGMTISLLGTWLEDGPPLRRDDYVRQFTEGRNYYFIAHPLTT